MDYCNKGDMLAFLNKIKDWKLDEDRAIYYLNQLKNAFVEMRNHYVIHRDIKLENIFLHNEILKLGDFGFAKMNIDFTTSWLGSKLTMAPEILLNLNNSSFYDYKCDLWSIGCVFY